MIKTTFFGNTLKKISIHFQLRFKNKDIAKETCFPFLRVIASNYLIFLRKLSDIFFKRTLYGLNIL